MTCQDSLNHIVRHSTSKIALELGVIERACGGCRPVTDDGSLTVKNQFVLLEIAIDWHTKLKDVFLWICENYPDQVMITSGFRPLDSGIHNIKPLRAFDLRSRLFAHPEGAAWHINDKWEYGDGEHKVCIYHRMALCNACGKRFEIDLENGLQAHSVCPGCGALREELVDLGRHFHLQVRDETRMS